MNLIGTFLNLLFPSRCPSCDGPSASSLSHHPFCSACWEGIERYTAPACLLCGVPTSSFHTTRCASCMKTPPPFSKTLFYGIYDGTLKEAIHLLKFRGLKRLARPLGLLLATLPLPPAHAIVPVPLHKKRLREREFNQTALLGRWLSKERAVPLLPDALRKTRETPHQTGRGREERLKNVLNAFDVPGTSAGQVEGRDLLLLDDVITTGTTARECSRALAKAGARSVTVVALARSLPRQHL
ncbi:MAG: ComF family protein [Alphaproteobacteria bacterium]|uniref:ComF family protein n=1 Tax=Candidatus Nitrobium versatile TaxID=2884831 RepID=A0A953M163_9BACT|nr:ComF family protein [Candidatus Nitrobium versatile]